MGTLLGNLIGFVALIVSAVVALFSLEAAAAVFACIAYLAFAVIWLLERAGRPTVDSQMPLMLIQGMLLTDEQFTGYRRYHIFVNFPAVGQMMSALLNNLRVVAIVWAIVALWNGYWWSGIANAGCFVVFAASCARLDPIMYLRSAASAGHPYAVHQLQVISSLVEAREQYLESLSKQQTP